MPPAAQKSPPGPVRVVVAIETFAQYTRSMVRGVADYARLHQPGWEFLFQHSLEMSIEQKLRGLRLADGMITHQIGADPRTRRMLRRSRKPIVVIEKPPSRFPTVAADHEAIGRMAFEHLRSKGLRRFTFALPTSHWPFDARRRGFTDALDRGDMELIEGIEGVPLGHAPWAEKLHWSTHEAQAWLAALPRPIGIFAGNIGLARQLATICNRLGIYVPEQVAILGVDRDELLSDLSRPSLSTIDHNMERAGYEAAALLGRLLDGADPPNEPILIEPLGVIERHSTDTLAIEDEHVARAVRYIRENALDPIEAADVLRHVPVARRSLEVGFRRWLGRTIGQEIRRVRIEHAKTLLLETELPGPDLAVRCGFNYASRLSEAFKKVTGLTPTEFRRRARGG